MADSIFITGAHGFVGRHLLERLDPSRYATIRCLIHRQYDERLPGEPVAGDLLYPAGYRKALAGCQTVIHLAALTGDHPKEDYFRINAAGTAALVSACEANSIRRFLHVSTVAVNFPDLRHYPYALSKQQAEEAVRTSGLRWAIVRPTMVFGPGARALRVLTRLAVGRRVRVVDHGRVMVQPIYVDDLVGLLLSILENDRFDSRTIEAGGPDILPLEELLQRIREAHGLPRGKVASVPLRLARPIASAIEAFARPLLPLSAGQLIALASDGTAEMECPGIGVEEALRLALAG